MPKVLIAEDDLVIADAVKALLINRGYAVCGIARTVAQGVLLGCFHQPDLVIVELWLAEGGIGTEIAAYFEDVEKIGILYLTTDCSHIALTTADGDACLCKPYRDADLLRSLRIVGEMVAKGRATPPFPRGFQVLAKGSREPGAIATPMRASLSGGKVVAGLQG